MSNVWRIGSNWGDYGPIKAIFERHRLAFAGDEVQDPMKKVLADDIVAITSGKRIIGVGRVARVAALSEIGINDFARFGDRIALVLSPLFWRDENEQWLDYDGQGKQFHKAHGDYVGAIITIFNARNRQLQKDKMKNEIKALLEANKQTILTGAPGTGKTFLAREVAADMLNCSTDELKSKKGFSFVQFHPAYDYTDFVEGLKPVKAGNNPNNSIGFELRDGVFMEFCKKSEKQDGKCVFVIDEINRADLSRVFGELFYALEPDYQGYGTPGSELMKRAANPRAAIDGKPWGLDSAEIKARVVDLSGFFSGHADHAGLLDYIFDKQGTQPYRPLKRVFLVHGDDNARTELCRAIEELKHQNSSARRIIERVELPSPAGPWFDLVREKWVWEFHPKVEHADQAVNSGFGRLEKLEKMVQSFCEKGPNAISLDEIIDQVNLAKFHLASARGAESGET